MAGGEEGFKYISYATMREAWTEIKVAFFLWLIVSVISIVIGGLAEAGISFSEPLWSDIPKPLLYVIAFAVFSWFFRGEEIRIVFPKTFKLWAATMILFVIVVLGGTTLPMWAMIPVYFGVILAPILLESLAQIGKANYDRLVAERAESNSGEA